MSARHAFQTTMIGSLPYHNVDTAIAASFTTTLPALPQIPARHRSEYMIPQALDGLPGAYEPDPSTCSAWRPFLWELSERHLTRAKIQIAGPITCQWARQHSQEQSRSIVALILARSIAMIRKLKETGIDSPFLFIDEPGLAVFDRTKPRHWAALQELRILVLALQREGAQVGLHCCADTDWSAILEIGLNILSFDTQRSLDSLLRHPKDLVRFIVSGGQLSLGVIPTDLRADRPETKHPLRFTAPEQVFAHIRSKFEPLQSELPIALDAFLSECLYTPACGLALHRTEDAQAILGALSDFRDHCISTLPAPGDDPTTSRSLSR